MIGKNILITGASGLIGSEVASFYSDLGFRVYGVDNNMRQIFFGKKGSTELRVNNSLNELHIIKKRFNNIPFLHLIDKCLKILKIV